MAAIGTERLGQQVERRRAAGRPAADIRAMNALTAPRLRMRMGP